MPRGVYDRSKVKSKKTDKTPKASKSIKASAADAPKQKRKYTKRGTKNAAVEVSKTIDTALSELAKGVGEAGIGPSLQGNAGSDLLMIATQVGSMMSAINSVMSISERLKGDVNQEKLDNLTDSLIEMLNSAFNKSTQTLAPVVTFTEVKAAAQAAAAEVPAEAPKRRGRPPKAKPAVEAPVAPVETNTAAEPATPVVNEAPKAEVTNGQQTMTPLPQPVPFFSAPITQ